MMNSVKLPEYSLHSFKDEKGKARPIVMVNLLRFRERALYVDGESSLTGEQAYRKYAKTVIPLILEVGGFPVWAGKVRSNLIAGKEEKWDQVALIAYPSRKAFFDMHLTNAYTDCVKHRNAGLADVRLIETRAIYFPTLLVRVIGLFFRLKAYRKPRKSIKGENLDLND